MSQIISDKYDNYYDEDSDLSEDDIQDINNFLKSEWENARWTDFNTCAFCGGHKICKELTIQDDYDEEKYEDKYVCNLCEKELPLTIKKG